MHVAVLVAGLAVLAVVLVYAVYGIVLATAVQREDWFDIDDTDGKSDVDRSRWGMSHDQWRRQVRATMELEPAAVLSSGDHVFELGCGTCAFLDELLAMEPALQLSGNDINGSALGRCRSKHPAGTFEVGKVTELDAGQQYDCIVGNGVLIYMQSLDEVRETLAVLDTWLKPGKTMRFTLLDPPITAASFLSFRCSITSGRLRIPPALFEKFARDHGYKLQLHFTDVMNGQGGRRYIAVLEKNSYLPKSSASAS